MRAGSAPSAPEADAPRPVAVLPVVVASAACLVLISLGAQWYGREAGLGRYCGEPERTVAVLERILTEERPAGDATRRPYVVTAKLLYLVPRRADEPLRTYLDRIGEEIRRQCR